MMEEMFKKLLFVYSQIGACFPFILLYCFSKIKISSFSSWQHTFIPYLSNTRYIMFKIIIYV